VLQITANGPNRIDIEFSGKVGSEEMRIALDDLITQSKDIEHGRILYRIEDMELPSLGAIGVELSRLPELFRLIGKFDRAAVIANQKWIQKVGEIEGALIPGLKIKGFNPGEEAEAEAWLEG
jgi:hypothetical protein